MAIKPLASGQYLVRVSSSFNGKRVEKKKVCRTKQEALLADKQFKAQLETSKNSVSGVNPKNWHCCLDRYLSYAKESMSMTASYNREVCLNAVTAAWMFRDIETISVDEISFVVNNNAYKYSYKKDLLKFIKAVFEYSVASRVTNFNPCKFVKIKFEKSELSQAKVLRAMTYTETLKLLKFVKECDENWYAIFAVTYYLGLRLSEAIELKIGDLNFERRIVTVSRSWCKKKKGSVPPKNGLSRKVSMSPTIESLLKELSKDKKTGDYVLPRVSPWITGMGAKTLNKYQDLLEIRRSNYHSLRASFITHLLNNGVPIIKVQAMVGHADLKTTQRYVRLDASDLEGATAVLG